jgi:hypothetical protein
MQISGSTTPFPVEDFLTALGKTSKVIAPSPAIHVVSHISLNSGVDSSLSDNFGRTIVGGLSVITTFLSIGIAGGPRFFLFIILIASPYWNSE